MNPAYLHPLTPQPPDFRLDWDEIRAAYSWVRAMAGVLQEPEYHAEGDVEVHTRMVCEALVADPDWRALERDHRSSLFVAALLHDVAKPATTVLVDGRWTAPKHAVKGSFMARDLLWRALAGPVPDFFTRERIVWLVRYHGLPLRFIDKPQPDRAVRLAACSAPHDTCLRDLHLLAKADVEGRISHDLPGLRDRLALFADFCRDEVGCWDQPPRFESGHHRFMYFVGCEPYSYVPYVPAAKPEVTVMCGLPGMGKSTLAREIASDLGAEHISLDAIRVELGIDPADRGSQGPAFRMAESRLRNAIRFGRSAVWDSTTITREARGNVVAVAAKYGAETRIAYVECDREENRRRNRNREAVVPEDVIEDMARRLEVPTRVEAHRCEHWINGVCVA